MKKWLVVLLLCLFVMGCSDVVGEAEFICPVCDSTKAVLHSHGESKFKGFHFHCYLCGTKSGEYKSFTEALKVWKISLGNSEGDSK